MTSGLFKVEGAGNDFLLGLGEWALRLDSDARLVRRLCDRRRGIGADGTLALSGVDRRRVRLSYRNADGGVARFCANGTRCAARAAVELLGCLPALTVETGWGEVPARVDGARVSLELPPPDGPPQRPELPLGPPLHGAVLLPVGVPHLVVEVDGPLAELDIARLAPPLRGHSALGPEGANVNFFAAAGPDGAAVRSWERGVEGETLSCGSGLLAVALVVMQRQGLRELTLLPASGDRLQVEALGEPPSCRSRLTGPARFVAEVHPGEELMSDL